MSVTALLDRRSTRKNPGLTISVQGLPVARFAPLFELPDTELAKRGICREFATASPGFSYPCRVSLAFAEEGEELLLLNYRHLDRTDSPYRAEGPIYVRRNGVQFIGQGEYPEIVMQRMMSIRAYDGVGMMREAEVAEKGALEAQVADWFARPEIRHIDVHSMRRGCFFCRIERA